MSSQHLTETQRAYLERIRQGRGGDGSAVSVRILEEHGLISLSYHPKPRGGGEYWVAKSKGNNDGPA